MAQLNLRLDDDMRDGLDALARAHGHSLSDEVRDLVRTALGWNRAPDAGDGDDAPVSLSALDRVSMVLQHQVLAALAVAAGEDPKEDYGEVAHHNQMVEILERGYSAEYHRLFAGLYAEMTRRECDLVHDILEMFLWTERSVEGLPPKVRPLLGDELAGHLSFSGFDFNSTPELRLAGYARYLTSHGHWEEMAPYFDDRHERGNSHWPTLATYQQMLSSWKPIWQAKTGSARPGQLDSYLLDVDELREIALAGYRA